MKADNGSMLLQVLVLATLLAMLGGMSLSFLMGRAMVVEKISSAERARFLTQAADSKLNGCLQNATYAVCNSSSLEACGFPMHLGGRTINATAAWVNSSCQVTIEVLDY